jgi:hypothetical protein
MSPMHCDEVAPSSWGGTWCCSYPEMQECHDPVMIAVDDVQIESIQLGDISLGKKRRHKKANGEIHNFSRQSGTRKEYFTETA